MGQTLANLAMTAGRLDLGGVWDLEDEEALAAARTLIEQHAGLWNQDANGNADTTAGRRAPSDSTSTAVPGS